MIFNVQEQRTKTKKSRKSDKIVQVQCENQSNKPLLITVKSEGNSIICIHFKITRNSQISTHDMTKEERRKLMLLLRHFKEFMKKIKVNKSFF